MANAIKWLVIFLAVLALFGAGAVGLYHTPWFKHRVADWASAALGREVVIQGQLGLDWELPLGLTATGVKVADAQWSQREYLLEVSVVRLRLDPIPLLQGRLVLPLLELLQPRLHLQRSESGQANWAFLIRGKTGQLPDLRELALEDGELSFAGPAWNTRDTWPFSARLEMAMGPPLQANGQVRLGESDLEGRLTLRRQGERPTLEGELESRRLDLAQLRQLLPRSSGGGGDGDLIPALSLQFPWLKRLDARLDYTARQVNLAGATPGRVELGLQLEDGRLRLAPLAFSLLDGRLDLSISIGGGSPPPVSAQLSIRRLDMEPLLAGTRLAGKLSGVVGGDARLEGQGSHLDAWLAGADGRVSLALRDAHIDRKLIEKIGLDPLSLFAVDQTARVAVRCGIAEFDIADGIVQTQTLLLAALDTRITAHGSIDLADGALDLALVPHIDEPGLVESKAVIRISGSLRNPNLAPDLETELTAFTQDTDSDLERCRQVSTESTGQAPSG